jgi:hypothetical protein
MDCLHHCDLPALQRRLGWQPTRFLADHAEAAPLWFTTWDGWRFRSASGRKAAPLTPDDWEQVRLRAYHSERVLARSPFLAALAPVATVHQQRLDGSCYHQGVAAATLTRPTRLLAADAYHAMTEPRPGSAQNSVTSNKPRSR